ncbi:MAG: sodium-translocating pyrophosphatase [Candidatus Diapherotrites archaeon]
MSNLIIFVFAISILALIVSFILARWVLAKDTGTEKMRVISDAIAEGANAFIKRQYVTIALLTLAFAVLMFGAYFLIGLERLGLQTSVAFIFGALSSGLAGIIGMWISIRANIRTASASTRSMREALRIALRAGGVSAITIVAMSLLGITVIYVAYQAIFGLTAEELPFVIVGYGFGASFVALFAQLGGGIYTKAADVGADLVGKIEAGIPEDDPRNPAVIADLVGDNVGDCAGRGADLFESTAAENIGAMILGVALYPVFGLNGILFPLVARAVGLVASIIGIITVDARETEDPMNALNRGYYVTAALAVVGLYMATEVLLGNIFFFYAGCVGIIASILFVWITVYYTERRYRPVKTIAEASRTGHATNIISGIAVGLESTALPAVVLGAALIASFMLGEWSGVAQGGLFGTAVATMGMLSTAAYILSMDTFGPITDNAGGIVEMSGQPEKVRKITDRLDAVGNTTKALTKGYAVGSAGLAAFLLFSAFMVDAKLPSIDISKVPVFVGALLGAALIFMFSSLAIRAVGKTAYSIVNEVRRQFKEMPGIMKGKQKPDYARCVDICVSASLKEMVLPGVLVVATTVAVGMLLKAEAIGAFLMVGTITGIITALFMNNGGGAMDNAKKYIEEGHFGGKGSDAHKAAVTGDTVGDPLKDTAGPSLHVLIKLLGTITLVLLPLFL